MSQESLQNIGTYRLAMELFDLVVHDMGQVARHPETYRLIGQQVASADSICSNIVPSEVISDRIGRGDAVLGIISKAIYSLTKGGGKPPSLSAPSSLAAPAASVLQPSSPVPPATSL